MYKYYAHLIILDLITQMLWNPHLRLLWGATNVVTELSKTFIVDNWTLELLKLNVDKH